jgi:large subunit ribosomal protein L28
VDALLSRDRLDFTHPCGSDTLVRLLAGRIRPCLTGHGEPIRSRITHDLQEYTVAAVCDICAKKPGFGNNRPWSRKITKRRFNPNIQRVRATINGTPKRVNICTGCLKAGKVSR